MLIEAVPPFFAPAPAQQEMIGQLWVRGKCTSTATRDSLSLSFCHITSRERRSSGARAGVSGFVLVRVAGVAGGGRAFFAPVPIQKIDRSTLGQGETHFCGKHRLTLGFILPHNIQGEKV